MGKVSKKSQKSTTNTTAKVETKTATKVKRTRKTVARDSPPQRSSIYRGVTRHRWTGRYEAHLWDKNCWNESQNKKGRQVYLGAYDDEEVAAHAYDMAALKYWGQSTILNFPLSTYEQELKEMEGLSREEYIGSLRRKSSGFSRGVSKYRGVARHHHNGRWEARIGRVFGNKYLYLGTYATQEEAATAYDLAAIEYRGLNAVTNFDISRYIKWLRPNNQTTIQASSTSDLNLTTEPNQELDVDSIQQISLSNSEVTASPPSDPPSNDVDFFSQSSEFKEIIGRSPFSGGSLETSSEFVKPSQIFPDDIQTYFDYQYSSDNYTKGDDIVFDDLSQFVSSFLSQELDND